MAYIIMYQCSFADISTSFSKQSIYFRKLFCRGQHRSKAGDICFQESAELPFSLVAIAFLLALFSSLSGRCVSGPGCRVLVVGSQRDVTTHTGR